MAGYDVDGLTRDSGVTKPGTPGFPYEQGGKVYDTKTPRIMILTLILSLWIINIVAVFFR